MWAPRDSQAIAVHRTDIYPIQTMHIDESSIRGNVEVVDAVHNQLNVDTTDPKFMKRVRRSRACGPGLAVGEDRARLGQTELGRAQPRIPCVPQHGA